ncbi:unnamed protein product [Moneuplotes crassus]|uniref:Uncharacterized protein n=1 Tax=Euplotes crassus TaxID=5936 RepID=A0AAD1Y4Y7_EUPCR|nr:unnamed protein product [Moneuplotes crassus]
MKTLNRKRKGLNQDQSGAILLTKIRTNKPMRSKTNGNSMQSFVFHGKEKISQSEISDEEIENIKMEEKSLMKPPKLAETPINILEKNSPSQKSPEVVIYPQSRNLKHLSNHQPLHRFYFMKIVNLEQ